MDARDMADPLEAERTRAVVRRRLFGGPEEPLRAGRFLVGERIGAGGMGAVYSARDPELERDVALKVLHGGGSLLLEAKALAKLRHPNVVSVHEVGTFAGHTFIAMEHAGGLALRAWLRERSRSWRAIVEVFVGAGRGLAAAHAAGLVHRDFKPDNVVVDELGHARVIDFGLAREVEEGDEDVPPGSLRSAPAETAPPASSRSRTRVAGTPAYMAPELFEGRSATPASDQYAFCVALFEALFGALPFDRSAGLPPPGATPAPLVFPSSDVPRRVRAAIARGLDPSPEARHPSMESLLESLSHDPRPRRARAAAAGAMVIAAAASILAIRGRGAPVCEGAGDRLAAVWSPEASAKVRASFEATGLPYASNAHATVEKTLNVYAEAWSAMYRASCEATHVRGEQSRELLDLRSECLSRRREALEATVRALASADARTVERSVPLVEQLPPLSACADAEALRSVTPPPADPAKRARLAELSLSLSSARVAYRSGQLVPAAEQASRVLEGARALDHRPFLAEALLLAGEVAVEKGDFASGEAALAESVKAAQATGYTLIVAQAAVKLVGVTGVKRQQFDKARVWLDVADASVDRARSPELRALLDDRAGAMLSLEGKTDEGLARLTRAVRASEAAGGTETFAFASYLNDWANLLGRKARHDEALSAYTRSIEITERLRGPMHPNVAHALSNRAIVLERRGRLEEARAGYQRALDIAEALGGIDGDADFLDNLAGVLFALGKTEEAMEKRLRAHARRQARFSPGHPTMGSSWNNLGQAYYRRKQWDKALDANERALAIRRAAYPGDHPDTAQSLGNMSEVYEARGDLPRALALVNEAVAMLERTSGAGDPDLGYFLGVLGRVELALRKVPEGRAHLSRAIAVLEAAGVGAVDLAAARFELARSLWSTARSPAEKAASRDLAERARKGMSDAGEKARVAEIEGWLRGAR